MSLTGNNAGDYFEGLYLNILKGVAVTTRTAFQLGLLTVLPADQGTQASPQDGTEVTTVNGTGGYAAYARQAVTPSTFWTALSSIGSGDPTGQQISNAAGVAWPGNNGGSTIVLVGIALYDNLVSTHVVVYWPIVPSFNFINGGTFNVAANTLIVQAD